MSTKEQTSPGKSSNGSQQQKAKEKTLSTDLKASTGQQQRCLSDHQSSEAQTSSLTTATTDNVDTDRSTPSTSQQNSPTKSTPTKSARNKRKNDARKRNANMKKQQKQQVTLTSVGKDTIDTMGVGEEKPDRQQNSSNDSTPSHIRNDKVLDIEANQMSNLPHDSTDKSFIEPSETIIPEAKDDNLISNNQDKNLRNQEPDGETTTKELSNGSNKNNSSTTNKITVDQNTWAKKQRESRELKEQVKVKDAQLQNFVGRIKQQMIKIKELEASLVSTTRTCNQFEKLIQQELSTRTRLENENESLNQTILRLKNQICLLEKDRSTNSELIRTLNATLMERETEVSILKLKMTRLQTTQPSQDNNRLPAPPSTLNNASSSNSMNNQFDSMKAYATYGRSNSEFSRNSYARSSMIAEASASARSSTSQLQYQNNDRDASVWAQVPEELTPSKRPLLLDRGLPFVPNGPVTPLRNVQKQQSSTPLSRDSRRYQTLPRSMKSPEGLITTQETPINDVESANINNLSNNSNQKQSNNCLVTNLDESNSTSQSSSGGNTIANTTQIDVTNNEKKITYSELAKISPETSHYCTISNPDSESKKDLSRGLLNAPSSLDNQQLGMTARSPPTPVKITSGLKKIFNVFRRTDSISETESPSKSVLRDIPLEVPKTPTSGPFQRGANRSTLIGLPGNARGTSVKRNFETNKPFAEWDTDMLVEWLTTIGLSMYANQCRRWVKCGAHIMNATPAEVDKGLGITNHLHRKKLRLAISELNGDTDKITKAAAKLDYLWVARWLDDIGLPQYKDAFINARVDGRVLNYLTVEDLFSMGVRSVLHHSSIKCGIKVLRSINFDLQMLKRRATADEIEQMSTMRQVIDDAATSSDNPLDQYEATDVPLWTCHRVMEWLRMIDFAEFAPNLRGSGLHGGLMIYEDGFTIETMSSLLGIPPSRTLLRRHLATFFDNLVGKELAQRKSQYKNISSNDPLDPKTNFKTPKKSPLWFSKLKSSKVGQDGTDEYLCPMYPVEPSLIKSPAKRKLDTISNQREGCPQLPRIPESINV